MRAEYPKEWDKYPSVTEVLDILPKPYIPVAIKNKAMEIGSDVHAAIEAILKNKTVEIDTQYPEEVGNAIKAFNKFRKDNPFEVIECEKQYCTQEDGFKGTIDSIVKFKNKDLLAVVDWKSSNAFYDTNYYQIAAYVLLYENNINAACLVRLDKKTGDYEKLFINKSDIDLYKDIFLATLNLYKLLKQKEKRDEQMGDRVSGK